MSTSSMCMILSKGTGNKDRIKYFMQKTATSIIGETSATAGHTERKAYADKVLSGEADIYQMMIAVVTNSTISSTISSGGIPSDNDIEFTVNSLWDDFSGNEGV